MPFSTALSTFCLCFPVAAELSVFSDLVGEHAWVKDQQILLTQQTVCMQQLLFLEKENLMVLIQAVQHQPALAPLSSPRHVQFTTADVAVVH